VLWTAFCPTIVAVLFCLKKNNTIKPLGLDEYHKRKTVSDVRCISTFNYSIDFSVVLRNVFFFSPKLSKLRRFTLCILNVRTILYYVRAVWYDAISTNWPVDSTVRFRRQHYNWWFKGRKRVLTRFPSSSRVHRATSAKMVYVHCARQQLFGGLTYSRRRAFNNIDDGHGPRTPRSTVYSPQDAFGKSTYVMVAQSVKPPWGGSTTKYDVTYDRYIYI